MRHHLAIKFSNEIQSFLAMKSLSVTTHNDVNVRTDALKMKRRKERLKQREKNNKEM